MLSSHAHASLQHRKMVIKRKMALKNARMQSMVYSIYWCQRGEKKWDDEKMYFSRNNNSHFDIYRKEQRKKSNEKQHNDSGTRKPTNAFYTPKIRWLVATASTRIVWTNKWKSDDTNSPMQYPQRITKNKSTNIHCKY